MTSERPSTAAPTRAPRSAVAHDVAAGDQPGRADPARPLLVIGLGNPDAQYAGTRHNIGAACIAVLARRHRVELKREGRVDRARITVDGHDLDIARPRSHMNDSGTPIAQEMRRLGLKPEQILVIYDDLDLPVGRVRMRLAGSSGGNNGLKSIITALGGAITFPRVRIGIHRPYDGTTPVYDPDRIAAWVLSKPHPEDRRRLDAAADRVADAVEEAARVGVEIAMNALNRWTPPEA